MAKGFIPLYFLAFISSIKHAETLESALEGMTCQEESTFGNYYRIFHKAEGKVKNDTDSFVLEFKVKTSSDAHILLSDDTLPTTESYEVVIGAGRNTFSFIRRGHATGARSRESTPQIVSASDYLGFWIRVYNEGSITVGKEGENMPFISLTDFTPSRVKYFSFTSWNNVYGKWYFNCRNNTEEVEEDKILRKPATITEKLRLDLLRDYDPFVAPQTSDSLEQKRTDVYAYLTTKHVHLDEKKSTLNVHGIMHLSWIDKKLQWLPSKYGNITSLVMPMYEAWIPDILLYNSASSPAENSGLHQGNVIVSSEGKVFWSPIAHYSAFCEQVDLRKWPRDTQICELQLGFWSQQDLLQLIMQDNGTNTEEAITGTEWKVTNISSETFWIQTPWTSLVKLQMDIPLLEDVTDILEPVATHEFEPEIVTHSSIAIRFTLSRQNSGYYTVLLTPLAMTLTFTILSFWASPFGFSKLAFQCLSLIMTTVFLLATGNALPAHADYIPSIISAYRSVMVMICISMISTVIIINFTRYAPGIHFPLLLRQLLTYKWVSFLFFLPTNVEQDKKIYNTLNEDEPFYEEELAKETSSNDNQLQSNWILLSAFIDRAMFIIYSIILLYILVSFL